MDVRGYEDLFIFIFCIMSGLSSLLSSSSSATPSALSSFLGPRYTFARVPVFEPDPSEFKRGGPVAAPAASGELVREDREDPPKRERRDYFGGPPPFRGSEADEEEDNEPRFPVNTDVHRVYRFVQAVAGNWGRPLDRLWKAKITRVESAYAIVGAEFLTTEGNFVRDPGQDMLTVLSRFFADSRAATSTAVTKDTAIASAVLAVAADISSLASEGILPEQLTGWTPWRHMSDDRTWYAFSLWVTHWLANSAFVNRDLWPKDKVTGPVLENWEKTSKRVYMKLVF
jgi:hypothetical protein